MFVCTVEYCAERDGNALRGDARGWGQDGVTALDNATAGVRARLECDRWFGGYKQADSLVMLVEVRRCQE